MVDVNKLYGHEHDKSDIVHSNSIARDAQGGRVGSTKHESFEARRARETMRKRIGGYKHSNLGSARGVRSQFARPRVNPADGIHGQLDSSNESSGRKGNRTSIGKSTAQESGVDSAQPKHRFTEPKHRGYDPYSRG